MDLGRLSNLNSDNILKVNNDYLIQMEEMYGQHKEEMIKENREKRKGYKMIRTYVLHVEYIIIRV